MDTFKRLLAYAKPHRNYWPLYLVLSILGLLFSLVNFALFKPLLVVVFEPSALRIVEKQHICVSGKEDYADFQEYNSRYVIETTAFKLIKEWYRKPLEEEDAQFRMPMDILRDLKTARKISSSMNRIDDITVGQALRALGYERIGKKIPGMGTRYGYKVMQLY